MFLDVKFYQFTIFYFHVNNFYLSQKYDVFSFFHVANFNFCLPYLCWHIPHCFLVYLLLGSLVVVSYFSSFYLICLHIFIELSEL